MRPAGSGERPGEFLPLRAGADGQLQPARELRALSRVRAPPARAEQALISTIASWSKLAAGLHPSGLHCRPEGGRVSGKGARIPAGPAHFPASPVRPISVHLIGQNPVSLPHLVSGEAGQWALSSGQQWDLLKFRVLLPRKKGKCLLGGASGLCHRKWSNAALDSSSGGHQRDTLDSAEEGA